MKAEPARRNGTALAAPPVIDLDAPRPETPVRTRVLLAHEVRLFAEVLRVALGDRAGFDVLPTVVPVAQALRAARQSRPHVVIMGLESATADAVEVLRQLRLALPDTPVLVVSDTSDAGSLTAAVAAGATGYVTMDADMGDLVQAVQATAEGKVLLSGRRLESLVRHLERRPDSAQRGATLLTAREREVLACLVQGKSTKAIAAGLCVSQNTARTHIQNVITKLGVHSRLEAAARAVQEHLI